MSSSPGVGAVSFAEPANEYESFQVQDQVVEFAEAVFHSRSFLLLGVPFAHAASSSATPSRSRCSSCALGAGADLTRLAAINAPSSNRPVRAYRAVWKPWSSAAPLDTVAAEWART